MQKKQDGSTYAPVGKRCVVCDEGMFPVGVIGLDHGHIYGMCNGLCEAGATVSLVYDPDPAKVAQFLASFPEARAAASREEVLESDVKMIATAAIPADRAQVGLDAMAHGKDFFTDKPAMTTLAQLDALRALQKETGRHFFVYFSERLHVEAMVKAEELVKAGEIGRVVQVMGWGPHRESPQVRPDWFYEEDRFGGILVDIGCHQIEQLLFFSGASDAEIVHSRVANYAHPQYPAYQDYGDVTLRCSNGVCGYFRVDWFTPDGLGAWGDGRLLVVGTDGYIEVRKYIDIANSKEGDHLYLVNKTGEQCIAAAGTCGFPFFGRMIRDCLNNTRTAMDQAYIFRVMELSIRAQLHAERIIHPSEKR